MVDKLRRHIPATAPFVFLLCFAAIVAPCRAQVAPTIVSPEVAADKTVTFRLRAPNAKEVHLRIESLPNLAMERNEDGIWSATTKPLEPDFYGYLFVVDGTSFLDPSNTEIKPNLQTNMSSLHVPGPESLPWEARRDQSHGVIHHHYFRSLVAEDRRDFFVYTPPDYDPKINKQYPVLYLLHGYSDGANAWIEAGKANVILDNLIDQGAMKPMIVVMPFGYGAPEILKPGGFQDAKLRRDNYAKFREILTKEIIPQVEFTYRVSKNRESHAVAGLSMGGMESLLEGLNGLDQFAWIGAFSSALDGEDFDNDFPSLLSRQTSRDLALLWVSCGKDDKLLGPNQKFRDWLLSKQIEVSWFETPGAHSWQVWRRNLASFLHRLFQGK